MHQVKELQVLFESYRRKQEFSGDPQNLYEPFRYMLDLPAKRLRPVMLLMACEMFGEPAKRALPQAYAIELFHNFTLIHDDIMDAAPLRRGNPTVYKKFGETTAILSGDAMMVYAYQYLIQSKREIIPALLEVFNASAIKVCEGQQLDMNYELNDLVTVEQYLEMIELKTATLIATSLKLGAIVGNASSADAKLLFEFGKQLGISFQLKDDWLDAFGEENKIGKQRGGDIIQNKKTILILEALRLADQKTRQRLNKYFSSKKMNDEEKVDEVLTIFQKLGIKEMVHEVINRYHSNALSHVDQITLSSKKIESLKAIASDLLGRQN